MVGKAARWTEDLERGLGRLTWVAVALGVLVTFNNGDTDVGGLKFLLPHISDVNQVLDPDTGILAGSRLTLTGTLAGFQKALFTIPTALTALVALIPILMPGTFLKSGDQPKDSLRGRFFRLVLGAILVVLPLAGFGFLVRENVSGAAPPKPKHAILSAAADAPADEVKEEGAAKDKGSAHAKVAAKGAGPAKEKPHADAPEVEVARTAYCPDGPLGGGYLIQNDQATRFIITLVNLAIFLVLATCFNLNKTSIHGFYRDRLYEAYLSRSPREPRVKRRLKALDGTRVGFPYHIISATLNQFHRRDELKDAQHTFMFSRLYCGSVPTGFRRTDDYHGGVDLADAVAISGAAISPIQARSVAARLLMLVLNMRLGQWYPNPDPEIGSRGAAHPALLPLLWEHRPAFLHRRARGQAPDEPRRYCFLSDGAHHDNLGLGLLLKRRCRLIIVSDVSHDPDYDLEEFLAVLREARAREGVRFDVLPMADVRKRLGLGTEPAAVHADPDLDLDPYHFRTVKDEAAAARRTKENFLVGRVLYPPADGGPGTSPDVGLIVLVKPSLTADLAREKALVQYARLSPSFPHDPDLEQMYDEGRVEAYRQLGQCVGEAMSRVLPGGPDVDRGGRGSSRERLMDVVRTLCEPQHPTAPRAGPARERSMPVEAI